MVAAGPAATSTEGAAEAAYAATAAAATASTAGARLGCIRCQISHLKEGHDQGGRQKDGQGQSSHLDGGRGTAYDVK